MSLVSGLTNQTVDYVYKPTKDGYGDLSYSLVYTNLQCRWQKKLQILGNKITSAVDNSILQRTSKAQMWVLPDYNDIDYSWKITKDSEDYFVMQTEELFDLDGRLDHIKLYLE